MRVCNHDGRLVAITQDGLIDIETASSGRFSADIQEIWGQWEELRGWYTERGWTSSWPDGPPDDMLVHLSCPVPRPRQIFAIGLNYTDHVEEAGAEQPTAPTVFTKFPSSVFGPTGHISLSSDTVDWEVEQVLVVGRGGRDITETEAWSRIAGMTVGQDLSDRELQLRPPAPQFSLGKSHARFAPIGPVVSTVEEFDDADDVALSCQVNGVKVQAASTRLLVFGVPNIVAHLSAVAELYPGDLIFTGTPAGVGLGRRPPHYLKAGDILQTWMQGVGTMKHQMVKP